MNFIIVPNLFLGIFKFQVFVNDEAILEHHEQQCRDLLICLFHNSRGTNENLKISNVRIEFPFRFIYIGC